MPEQTVFLVLLVVTVYGTRNTISYDKLLLLLLSSTLSSLNLVKPSFLWANIPLIIRMIKIWRMDRLWNVVRVGEDILGIYRLIWDNNIKMDLK
jgi:hypothetical protein